MSAFCPECQQPIDMAAQTCSHCGHNIAEASKAAMERPRRRRPMSAHFVILCLGTIIFLVLFDVLFRGSSYITNDAIQLVGAYLAFAVLTLGHGLLRERG